MKMPVKCPCCNSRILDSESTVKTITKIVKPYDNGPPKERWVPDYYIKCWKCKSKVAIKKINPAG